MDHEDHLGKRDARLLSEGQPVRGQVTFKTLTQKQLVET